MQFIEAYWLEFITLAIFHFFAVASPGPDFAVVLKHSINHGRKLAMYTSAGIGVGILIHVTYSLVGIGVIISTTPWLYNILMYIAAAYLIYLGIGAIRSQAQSIQQGNETSQESLSYKKAFGVGLLTNGLNPKATLFFLSVFALSVSPVTPLSVKIFYGIYLAMFTGTWFCMLAYVLGSEKVRKIIGDKGYIFDRVMGVIFVALAFKIVTSSI